MDLDGILFEGAREIGLPEGGVVLVASEDEVPLIYEVKGADQHAIVMNFDPQATDFLPLTVVSCAGACGGGVDQWAGRVRAGACRSANR